MSGILQNYTWEWNLDPDSETLSSYVRSQQTRHHLCFIYHLFRKYHAFCSSVAFWIQGFLTGSTHQVKSPSYNACDGPLPGTPCREQNSEWAVWSEKDNRFRLWLKLNMKWFMLYGRSRRKALWHALMTDFIERLTCPLFSKTDRFFCVLTELLEKEQAYWDAVILAWDRSKLDICFFLFFHYEDSWC